MATTITAINMKFAADSSEVNAAAKNMRSVMSSVNQTLRQAESPTEKLQKKHIALAAALKNGKITQEQFDKATKHLNSTMEDAGKSSMSMASAFPSIAALANPMTLALAAAAAAVAVLTAAFVAMHSAVTMVLDTIPKLDKDIKAATALGETTANVQALTFALSEAAGMDASGTQMALRELTKSIGEASLIGGRSAAVFKTLGISINEIANLSPADQFKMLVVALRSHNNQMEAASLAQELFGRQSRAIMAAVNSATTSLEGAESAARKLGLTLSEPQARGIEMANDAVNRLTASFEGIKTQFTAELAPIVAILAQELLGMVPTGSSLTSLFRMMADMMAMTLGLVLDIGQGLLGAGQIMKGDISQGALNISTALSGANSSRVLSELAEQRRAANEAAKSMEDQLANMNGLGSSAAKVTEEYESQIAALDLQIQKIKLGESEADRMRMIAEGYTVEQIKAIELKKQELQLEEQHKKALEDKTKQQLDATKKRADEMAKMKADAEKAFETDTAKALENAKKFFDDSRKRQADIRKGVAAGPGTGIEAGSAEAAKYMAEQANAAIGAAAVPDRPSPGEEDIVREARKQFEEIRKGNTENEKLLQKVVTAITDNGFQRIR